MRMSFRFARITNVAKCVFWIHNSFLFDLVGLVSGGAMT